MIIRSIPDVRTIRVVTINSSPNPTPSCDADMFIITALAEDANFNAPTGTPMEGQKLVIKIRDNGTARSLSWNAIYKGVGISLPTATIENKFLYVGLIYNANENKWNALALSQE